MTFEQFATLPTHVQLAFIFGGCAVLIVFFWKIL